MEERKLTGRVMIQINNNEPTEVSKIYDYEHTIFGLKQSPFLNDESQTKYNRVEYRDSSNNVVVFFITNEIENMTIGM